MKKGSTDPGAAPLVASVPGAVVSAPSPAIPERKKSPSLREKARPNVNVPQAVYDRLLPYAEKHGLLRDGRYSRSQAVGHALARAEEMDRAPSSAPFSSSVVPSAVVPVAPVVDWSGLRESLRLRLKISREDVLDSVLREYGMPRE